MGQVWRSKLLAAVMLLAEMVMHHGLPDGQCWIRWWEIDQPLPRVTPYPHAGPEYPVPLEYSEYE